MLKDISHAGGVQDADEILFTTPFGYMFAHAATRPDCLLPVAERTEDALLELGAAMADPGLDAGLNSGVPAVFTYLGQFIDHDITARTDRESEVSQIGYRDGRPRRITPLDPAFVVANLKNGRRPQLDLDSLYGDGPALLHEPAVADATEADALYAADKTLLTQAVNGGFDVPRTGRKALIADMRNDENLNVSQLHAAMLAFHNQVVATLPGSPTDIVAYLEARQLVRWAYQYAVVNDYLVNVCDRNVVADILANGPGFFGPATGGDQLFMPLEFSVAGFRFGHSMVRGTYQIRGGTNLTITDVLGTSTVPDPTGKKNKKTVDLLTGAAGDDQLKPEHIIEWSNYVQFSGMPAPQMARRIDPLLSVGLFDLSFESATIGVMIRHLAQRNLFRGYLLSIPTGQAVAAAMGVEPLTEEQLCATELPTIKAAVEHGRFHTRTPLWYYVLREAQVQKDGSSLGAVGSRLVAETLIGMIKYDPNSYWNNRAHDAVTDAGIVLNGAAQPIATIADLLDVAGVPK